MFFQDVKQLDFSVRTSNCLNSANIEFIGDLVTAKEGDLLRLNAFGRRSLNEIKDKLSAIGLHLGMHCPNWPPDQMPAAEALEAKIEIENVEDTRTLFEAFSDSFHKCGSDRNAEIFKDRIGISSKRMTLEEVGNKYSVTRERIRQIVAKSVARIIRTEKWDDILRDKINELLNERTEPLYLSKLAIEDPWFEGFSENNLLLENIIVAFSEIENIDFIDLDGSRVLCRINKDTWAELRRDTLNYLDQTIEIGHTIDDVEMYVQASVNEAGSRELATPLFDILMRDLNFSLINGDLLLTSVGNTMRSKLNTILQEAAAPLHYEKIAEIYREKFEPEALTRNIHARLSYMGFILFDRGTFGVAKHLNFSALQIADIIQSTEDLILNNTKFKQWHTSEILSALKKKINCQTLTKYTLGHVLKSSSKLKDVGRLSFKLKSLAEEDSDRIQIKMTIYNVLRDSNCPLTYDKLKELVSEHRGLGDHFLPIANELFSKIDSRTWGLLERDFTISRAEQKAIKDKFYDLLIDNNQAFHKSELAKYQLELGFQFNLTDDLIYGILISDSERYRVWHGGFVGAAFWNSPNRLSLSEAIKEILENSEFPIESDEIVDLVSSKTGQDFNKSRIAPYLKKNGLIFSSALNAWLKENYINDSQLPLI